MIRVNGRELVAEHFPDKSLLVHDHIAIKPEGENVISWYFESNEELVTLIFFTQHLRSLGITDLVLEMPYIPNARQDRVKGKADVFTLKYFANTINWLRYKKVRVLDPHSYVSEALIDRIEILYPDTFIEKITQGLTNLTFFYPDEGAAKRYGSRYHYPYAFGIKERDWQSGRIKGLDIAGDRDSISGNRILIIDDICSKGGTFYHSSAKLKELGADEIYLFVTHCEHSLMDGELIGSGLIKRIYTTNSIFTMEHDLVEVFDIRNNQEV